MKRFYFIIVASLFALSLRAATIATFNTSVGTWEIELFDETKPITVSNFIKYGTSGRFDDQLIHRWVPGFVIQGGGYRVDKSNPQQWEIVPVDVFGTITNEAQVGTFYSNTYGTIAMARTSDIFGRVNTNSATSQWYINLGDNSGPPANLDTAGNGYTVFGRVLTGTNILDKFVPPPPAHSIYINQNIIPNSPLAVLATNDLTYNDLVYVQISFRRDLDLRISHSPAGPRQVSWNSVAGVTNILEFTTDSALQTWQALTNLVPVRGRIQVADPAPGPFRLYRVKLLY